MIKGTGVDIQNMEAFIGLSRSDPFIMKSFTEYERCAAGEKSVPQLYLAERFAAKEAVIKAFRADTNHMRLCDIETRSDENGAPYVVLYGGMARRAEELSIAKIHISLSSDMGNAVAFAVAEGFDGGDI